MIQKQIIFVISFFATALSFSQTATINSKKVFEALPQMAKLDTLVTNENEKYIQEFGKKRALAQQEFQQADSLYKLKPKDEATIKAIEKAQTAQKELQEFETMANKKVAEYKDLLYKPYLEKIDTAVKAVATRRKFMQVLDMQQVPFVYINPTSDITDEVIKEIKPKK